MNDTVVGIEVPWLVKARALLGVAEIHGPQNEPRIMQLAEFNRTPNYTSDEIAWCALFVGGSLEQCGIRGTRSLAARSYTHWGLDCTEDDRALIPLGAIAVFRRDPHPAEGHVGFAVGYTPEGDIMVLGGNQHDAVTIAPIDGHRLIGMKWPIEFSADLRFIHSRIPPMQRNGALSTNEA